jgi:conjugation system TraG family ATPase
MPLAMIIIDHDTAGVIERYLMLRGVDERPLLQDISVRDGLRVGQNVAELYTLSDVEDLPPLCGSRINYDKYSTDRTKFSIGFASPLGSLLPCNHILNQYVFIGDGQQTIKKLEAKKLRLQSLSGYSRENAISRDAVNDFLNEAIGEQRLPVKAHFNVLCWSDDSAKVRDLKNLVGSAMAQMDASCKQETAGAAQVWFAGMPGNAGDFPMNDTFDTFIEQAACFFNLESNYRDSISPFGIRLGDRLTGKPVHVDISDEPMQLGFTTNRNKFILGPSGSGKSFFTNHLVRSYYEQGAHVVLVDVGHSYRGLCDLVGGYYFTYSETSPISFNPFYLADGDVLDTEKKESVKTLLLALWKKDDEPFRRSEYVALSNALTGYFDHLGSHPDIFPCFNTFYEYLMEVYLQVLEDGKVKERDFDVSNFLYVLNPYYRGGEFDFLLNATENLDLLQERFIVFEIDAVKDHPILFPVVTLILMEMFISKMRKLKGVRKVILIEECWKAIAKEGMAEYLKYLFKTVRKFFGEAIVVTQEVEDLIASVIVKQAIINNSDCKILLDQSKYQNKFEAIQELLGLTDTASAAEKLKGAHKMLGLTNQLSTEMEAIFNRWSRIRITDPELKRLIQVAMSPNKETYELLKTGKESELSSQFNSTVSAVLDYSLTSPSQQENTTKGTLFGFYNSVTGYYQNVKGYRDNEAKFKSIMGGTGLQRNQSAFDLANDFARHGNIVLKLN